MNIIIPAAGIGKRFQEEGYTLPKPLINVLGEPMIARTIQSLRLRPGDKIHIVYHQELDTYSFQSVIRKLFYDLDLHFARLNYRTRGPAETVLCGLNQITDLDERVLVLDCDTFHQDDIISMADEIPGNGIFYFDDKSTDPIFSYIQMDDQGGVTAIREKERISDRACVGAYLFESGKLLKHYCEIILNSDIRSNNEFYLSNIYAVLLQDGLSVQARRVDNFHCVGTPRQLQTYCLTTDGEEKKRFCFDLDGTLVTFPAVKYDYSTVEPIWKNIRLARYLHNKGHTVIIHTSRKMLSSDFNVGRATRLAHQSVFDTLERFEIPCGEIYFGKPFAHFYIDDLAVLPVELEKSIGFYNTRIDPRHFNQIEYGPDWVRKTTNNPGEVYWYQHVPESIQGHFPKLLSADGCVLTLEKISGINFSYLLVNNSLTKRNIESLVETLFDIHFCEPAPDDRKDYAANYVPKMESRYKEFAYYQIAPDSHYYLDIIKKELAGYTPSVGVIHGDLVFSNIFLCENQLIRFIDMRGRVGEIDTIYGDIYYDYAKIYQSLWGYDFILNDCAVNHEYLKGLREYFEWVFIACFSVEKLAILKYLTASLLFSMIPLHDDREKQIKYFQLIREILP